jgi:hypothetical protein
VIFLGPILTEADSLNFACSFAGTLHALPRDLVASIEQWKHETAWKLVRLDIDPSVNCKWYMRILLDIFPIASQPSLRSPTPRATGAIKKVASRRTDYPTRLTNTI